MHLRLHLRLRLHLHLRLRLHLRLCPLSLQSAQHRTQVDLA